ncbi:hypothetical protein LCGC14_0220000 [marine sediment metagenome]|uniref:Uncharacterized protein n=1 Tax=marine sediment metagenome TaxID=412755 RepID=A0A0F9UD70_9ZZZZ
MKKTFFHQDILASFVNESIEDGCFHPAEKIISDEIQAVGVPIQ